MPVIMQNVDERMATSCEAVMVKTDKDIIAHYLQHELPVHLREAIRNGPTRTELADILTHILLYAAPLSDGCVHMDEELNNGDNDGNAKTG